MGTVALRIGGKQHRIACRDGEEAHLEALGGLLDRHAAAAEHASGGSAERAMLLIALMLADELQEAQAAAEGAADHAPRLAALAERIEALADALEQARPNT
jgi:cell division protein ZapA